MITAAWFENSGSSVGMPRRSTEWASESSYTSVARIINSTTAASVTPPVPESDVHREHPAVQRAGFDPLPLFLERAAQPVQDAQTLLVATRGRQVQRAPQDRLRHDEGALVEEAHAQRLGASEFSVGRPQ